MASDNLEEYAIDIFDKTFIATKKIAQIIALNATDYAPKGWSRQLKRGIRAVDPKKEGTNIIARVESRATDINGVDYAEKIHNEILRHYNPEGIKALKGYSDFGEGSPEEVRYQDGYRKLAKSSTKYATKYLVVGLDKSDEMIDKLLDKISGR